MTLENALSRPEDPNFDYSPGHYLPFPMALVEFIELGKYLGRYRNQSINIT